MTLAAWQARDSLDGEVTLPLGPVPASYAIRINLVDACVHGWDIAIATGQDPALDAAGVRARARGLGAVVADGAAGAIASRKRCRCRRTRPPRTGWSPTWGADRNGPRYGVSWATSPSGSSTSSM